MKKTLTVPLWAAALTLTTIPLLAAGEMPKAISPAEMMKTEAYVLPAPEEVFTALQGAAGKADFAKLATAITKAPYNTKFADKGQKAVNLGMRVADAFVAVQAKDAAALRKASDAIEVLALELSADASLKKNIDVANNLAKDGKWNELRGILSTIRESVIAELSANKDQDAVTLAVVGGWLRGLNIATMALSEDYDAKGTQVLRAPKLVAYLKERLDKLGAKSKDLPFVKAALAEMEGMMKTVDFKDGETLKKEDVQKLYQTSSKLVAAAGGN